MEQNVLKNVVECMEETFEVDSINPDTSAVEVDLNFKSKCPFPTYHRVMGTDKDTCLCFTTPEAPIKIKPVVKTIGIYNKKIKIDYTKRALVLIIKIVKLICQEVKESIKTDLGIKFHAPDFNITYERDEWKIGKWLSMTLYHLLTTKYDDFCYVLPIKQKEIESNINSIILATRKKTFLNSKDSSDKWRYIFFSPVYISVVHFLMNNKNVEQLIQIEQLNTDEDYVILLLKHIHKLLGYANFKHYTSTLRPYAATKIPKELHYYACMDDTVGLALVEKYQ